MKKNYLLFILLLSINGFSQNLLLNGDLELWDNATTPTNWTKVENISLESSTIHGGTYSAKHTGGTKDLGQTIEGIVPGKTYAISIWYKVEEGGDGSDARIWSYWKNAAGENITDDATDGALRGPDNGYFDNNGNIWSNYSVNVVAPASASKLYFEVRTYSGAITYWDDLSVICTDCNSEEPTINITEPTSGTILSPNTTSINVSFTTNNFEIGTTDAGLDGHIEYFLNDSSLGMHYTTDPITISNLTTGENTIKLALVDNNSTTLNPEISSTITVTVPSQMEVANIAELRNGMQDGTIYKLTGEAILTFQQEYRNQKFIEDETGAILIDDSNGILTTTYNLKDGITNLEGTLGTYNGTMQFTPTTIGSAASSTNNNLNPAPVNIANYNDNFETYESELITINNVNFVDAGGTFETGTNYTISQGTDELVARTQFYDAEIIGSVIPNNTKITGIAGRYNDTPQIYIISLEETLSTNKVEANTVNMSTIWNQTATFNTKGSDVQVDIFNMSGELVKTSNGSNYFTINVSNLTQGVYVVRVTVDGKPTVKKVVKK